MVVIDHPVWRVASIATISFVLLFLASASKLRPVGAIIALIVGYGLDLLGTFQFRRDRDSRAALRVAVRRHSRWRVHRRQSADCAAAATARATRAGRSPSSVSPDAADPDDENARRFMACLREGAGEIPAWLKVAAWSGHRRAADIAALRQAAEASTAIMLLVELVTRDPAAALPASHRARARRACWRTWPPSCAPADIRWR